MALLAGTAQIPLIVVYHESATADRAFPVKKRKRAVKVTLRPRQKPKPKPVVVEPKIEQPKGQVVTVRAPEIEEPPPRKTKYLAEVNRKVKRERKARPSRKRGRKLGAAAPKEVSKVQSPQSRSLAVSAAPKVEQKQQLAAKANHAKEVERGDTKPSTEMMRSSASKALLPALDKASAIANLQTVTGASASDDALMDVKETGDETVLNTRQFKHWQFFDTVKRRVRKHWHPRELHRRYDPTGKVYGFKDRLTVVQVTLTSKGSLTRLQTTKDSGVDFLDSEARRALSKAAPFRNPPRALLDDRDQIVFSFGFLFEISTQRFKFFRM
ncbi:MAG: hypothetical protein ACI9WU_005018 [Myxococcota bacterium]|jgi:hypothetical protein